MRSNLEKIFEAPADSGDAKRMAQKARRAADFLKALAHENRLMILCILSQGEKSVSELEEMLSLRQPTVSQQLARLRADGLVATAARRQDDLLQPRQRRSARRGRRGVRGVLREEIIGRLWGPESPAVICSKADITLLASRRS